MKRNKFYFFISLILVFAFLYNYFYMYKTVSNNITVKTIYMGYSCGNFCNQYKVIEIVKGDRKFNLLVGKNISIKFKNKSLEKSIEEEVKECIICYDFYFWGELKKSKIRGYKFFIKNADIKLRNKDCCD